MTKRHETSFLNMGIAEPSLRVEQVRIRINPTVIVAELRCHAYNSLESVSMASSSYNMEGAYMRRYYGILKLDSGRSVAWEWILVSCLCPNVLVSIA